MTNILKTLFQFTRTHVGGGMLFSFSGTAGSASRDACGHFPDGGLGWITWNTWGFVGSVLSLKKKKKKLKHIYFGRLIENKNVICLQVVHRKNEFI